MIIEFGVELIDHKLKINGLQQQLWFIQQPKLFLFSSEVGYLSQIVSMLSNYCLLTNMFWLLIGNEQLDCLKNDVNTIQSLEILIWRNKLARIK